MTKMEALKVEIVIEAKNRKCVIAALENVIHKIRILRYKGGTTHSPDAVAKYYFDVFRQ